MRLAAGTPDHVGSERNIMAAQARDDRKKDSERGERGEADKPASASDVMPPHELLPRGPDQNPEGTNATIHHPDPQAEQHRARGERGKERGPYVTGNS